MKLSVVLLAFTAAQEASAFAPISSHNVRSALGTTVEPKQWAHSMEDDEPELSLVNLNAENSEDKKSWNIVTPLATASLAWTPLAANAADASTPLFSALAAYGHYLSLFVMVGALMFERLTVAPGMPRDTEKTLVIADAVYGLSAVTLLVSGYYRAVDYGKGWEFYSHEPIFWLKMVFFMILGSASLFPTLTSILRGSLIESSDWEPMSEKLAARMITIINAELLMMASIPLTATLMSRGIGYTNAVPVEIIGPVVTGVTAVGLGFKYAKEAITWSEDDDALVTE